jgi:hypothetical protein
VANDPNHILSWPKPDHGFKAVRQFVVGATDMQLTWGIGYINVMLAQAPLKPYICKALAPGFKTCLET